MLTSDLVRTRLRDGRLHPQYLDTDSTEARQKAEELIGIFEAHGDEPYGAIEEEVDRAIGHGTDYLIWRGLAKLLYDRSEFETVAAAEPREIRRTLFEVSAEVDREGVEDWRAEVLRRASERLEVAPAEAEAGMYADLEERQRLVEFETLEPLELLNRYNLALAQAVLYKATNLEVRLRDLDPNRLRYLFQALKFNRLMHRIERTDDGYLMYVDGPESLFKRSRKYGIQMAKFLPAIVTAEDWEVSATLDWEDEEARLEVTSDDGLVSHYDPKGQWVAEEERYFEKRFEETDTGEWELEREGRILPLEDNEVIIPDYVLRHPDGREAYMEIVGFWRLSYLERRIEMLRRQEDLPLILAVSERLKAGRRELESSPAAVFFFKTVILSSKAVEAAEQIATTSNVDFETRV